MYRNIQCNVVFTTTLGTTNQNMTEALNVFKSDYHASTEWKINVEQINFFRSPTRRLWFIVKCLLCFRYDLWYTNFIFEC